MAYLLRFFEKRKGKTLKKRQNSTLPKSFNLAFLKSACTGKMAIKKGAAE
jgi:hypothetical protein